jgi:hypothetical protein
MRRVLSALAVIALLASGCREKPQPAETKTDGNATDRNPATGTTGTGEPASQATQTAAAATGALGTIAPSAAATSTEPVVSGTADVHAANTVTTSTIQGPKGTSTASVATPTQTTATVKH